MSRPNYILHEISLKWSLLIGIGLEKVKMRHYVKNLEYPFKLSCSFHILKASRCESAVSYPALRQYFLFL